MSQQELAQIKPRLYFGRLRAAELLDVSYKTLDNYIRQGAINTRKVGRRVLISREELLRFVENQPTVRPNAPTSETESNL